MTDGGAMNRAKRIKKKAARAGGLFFDVFDLILEVIDMIKNAK